MSGNERDKVRIQHVLQAIAYIEEDIPVIKEQLDNILSDLHS